MCVPRSRYGDDVDGKIPETMSEAPIQTGDYMPVDKYMTLPQAGTVLIAHYDTFHRGSPRLPNRCKTRQNTAFLLAVWPISTIFAPVLAEN